MRNPKVKIGDIVALTWIDICSYGRIEDGDDANLITPAFVSYGRVSYEDKDKIVLLHESEVVTNGHAPMREPTVYPWGCVTKVERLRPY